MDLFAVECSLVAGCSQHDNALQTTHDGTLLDQLNCFVSKQAFYPLHTVCKKCCD